MTIIAWDGVTLAADKQSTNCGYGAKVTKIFRVPGGIVGFMGNGPHAMELLAWFKAGRVLDGFPKKSGDDFSDAVFISNDGLIQKYSGGGGPYPIILEDGFSAFGAGRDYALAVMHLGKNAYEAVEVACALDTTCGRGIDTLTLEL